MAQLLHTSIGAVFTLGAVAIGHKWYEGAGTIIALDLVKELTFDQTVEKSGFVTQGLVDWSFYGLGVWVAVMLLGATDHL
jgi:hypothetical protein